MGGGSGRRQALTRGGLGSGDLGWARTSRDLRLERPPRLRSDVLGWARMSCAGSSGRPRLGSDVHPHLEVELGRPQHLRLSSDVLSKTFLKAPGVFTGRPKRRIWHFGAPMHVPNGKPGTLGFIWTSQAANLAPRPVSPRGGAHLDVPNGKPGILGLIWPP